MKRAIVLVAIVGAAMMTIGLTAQQPAPQAGREGGPGRGGGRGFTFPPVSAAEKVADNLYMIPGQGGNTAAFVTANGVVLVDTKLANNGQAILDQVKKVTDKPISHIINTHTHGDHTGSNDFFPASVEIVTQENTAANMKKMPEFQDAGEGAGAARPHVQGQADAASRQRVNRPVLFRRRAHQRRCVRRVSQRARGPCRRCLRRTRDSR